MGAFRTLQEGYLDRQVAELEQELIRLKTPQKYLVGQTKGYVSNAVNVSSILVDQQSGYYRTRLRYQFLFTGNLVNKLATATISATLYDWNGNVVTPLPWRGLSQADKILFSASSVNYLHNGNLNETVLTVEYFAWSTTTARNFSGDFYCITNGPGMLSVIGRI